MTRFTETEYALLQDYAKSSNKPVSTYVHDAALSNKVEICYKLTPSMPELVSLAGSFGKTASNLNQIARHFNEGGSDSAVIRKDINLCIAEIFGMRNELKNLKTNIKDKITKE